MIGLTFPNQLFLNGNGVNRQRKLCNFFNDTVFQSQTFFLLIQMSWDTSTMSFLQNASLWKSALETVLIKGFTVARRKSIFLSSSLAQKFASLQPLQIRLSSMIATEFWGRPEICFWSFSISFFAIPSGQAPSAFSILSNRNPNKRTGSGTRDLISFPFGWSLVFEIIPTVKH